MCESAKVQNNDTVKDHNYCLPRKDDLWMRQTCYYAAKATNSPAPFNHQSPDHPTIVGWPRHVATKWSRFIHHMCVFENGMR